MGRCSSKAITFFSVLAPTVLRMMWNLEEAVSIMAVMDSVSCEKVSARLKRATLRELK